MSLAEDIKAVRNGLEKGSMDIPIGTDLFTVPKEMLDRILSACEEMEKALDWYECHCWITTVAWHEGTLEEGEALMHDKGHVASECLNKVRGE